MPAPVDQLPWPATTAELDDLGSASAGTVLTAAACGEMATMFDDDARFRSTVDMARHRFGDGRYRSAAPMRHGVSTVRSGTRHTLGLLFHDAT